MQQDGSARCEDVWFVVDFDGTAANLTGAGSERFAAVVGEILGPAPEPRNTYRLPGGGKPEAVLLVQDGSFRGCFFPIAEAPSWLGQGQSVRWHQKHGAVHMSSDTPEVGEGTRLRHGDEIRFDQLTFKVESPVADENIVFEAKETTVQQPAEKIETNTNIEKQWVTKPTSVGNQLTDSDLLLAKHQRSQKITFIIFGSAIAISIIGTAVWTFRNQLF